MIQRIQSVYLVVAAVAAIAVPLAPGLIVPDGWSWYTPVKAAASILIAVGCLVAIFLYKDRVRQRGLVTLDVWLAAALAVMIIVSTLLAGALVFSAMWPALLSIVAFVLLSLARGAIKKDIELVRSMDRLR